MSRSVIARLRVASHAMSPALARIAAYVLARPERVLSQTITELAEQAGSSEASVIRLCRDQGFGGFQQFKLALASELAVTLARSEEAGAQDAIGKLVARAVGALQETGELLDRGVVAEVAARLAAARRIVVTGVGASAITADYAHYKLVRLGLPGTACADPHLAAMAATGLGEDDVLLVVSSSGSTMDSVRVAEIAARRGAFVAAITNRTRSPLVAACKAVLVASWPETPLTGGALPSKIPASS